MASLRGRTSRALCVRLYLGALALSLLCGPVLAQELLSQAPQLASLKPEAFLREAPAPAFTKLREAPQLHRFLDKENWVLFSSVAGLCAGDFAVTRANLTNGGKELNPLTRIFAGSTAGLATNFVGETVSVVGLSYYFHRTGHHKLERIAPMLNIAASGFAVAYSAAHH